jgi:RimJ/RimL family protein N-acetyltransferase
VSPVLVERLLAHHERAALAYLNRAPYENAFLASLIHFDPSVAARAALYVALDGDAVAGVIHFGRQVVLAADDSAIPAFAALAIGQSDERMIVGPREQVRKYWAIAESHHAPARRVRDRQPVMVVDAASLRGDDNGVSARRATLAEWETVAENAAQMILGELEHDVRSQPADFASGIQHMIERGVWWLGEREDRACFFCNVGPVSDCTAQLQGIWTPPALRGRGLATGGLYAVCRRLLEEMPTLSLYVNDFNTEAIALYERLGFARVGELTTLLF